MLLNDIQVNHKIEASGSKMLEVYHGKVESVDTCIAFEKLISKNSEDLREKFKVFCKMYKGETFTGVLKPSETTHKEANTRLIFFFTTSEKEVVIEQKRETPQNGVNRDEIKKEILAELKEAQTLNGLRTDLKDANDKLNTREDKTDRIFESLTNLAMGVFMPPDQFKQYHQMMNGIPADNQQQNGQKTEDVTDLNELENAFVILRNQIGDETIIKLANKVKDGLPSNQLAMLTMFINS